MLSTDEVRHIALLARIGMREEEIATYQKDLSRVLDFFSDLEKALPEDLPIGRITGTTNRVRLDVTEDFGQTGKDSIVKNIPETKNGFIKVKSIF